MPNVPQNLTCGVIPGTPVGPLTLTFSSLGLIQIQFDAESKYKPAGAPFQKAEEELNAYFSGKLTDFSVKLAPQGTVFQKQVWTLLQTIPYGETRSYGQLARMLGGVNLARAIGHANGSNPIPIIYPCHRVVGGKGQLTGYSGGIHRKQTLLQLEAQNTSPDLFSQFGDTQSPVSVRESI